MGKKLHKTIRLISVIAMIIFTITASAGILLLKSGKFTFEFIVDEIIISWCVSMIFPLIALITSYSIYRSDKHYIRKTSNYIFYLYPVILLASFMGIMNSSNTILTVIISTLLIFLTIIFLMNIFVFADATKLKSTIVFIILIILSIILKRYRLNYAGFFISLVLAMFSMGCFMYGTRCLYLAGDNKYLKYVAFCTSFVITIFFMAILWKMQHWPLGNLLVYSSSLLLPLLTIVVFLTLPSSGFIEWKILHKKILFRLLLPWTLIFLLFILKYLLPEVDSIIWSRDVIKSRAGFDMPDYKIELRNNPSN